MAVTIIDSLMVTLGLDPNPFKKAQLEAERSTRKFKEENKKQTNEIADAFTQVGRQAAVMLLGFEGIKGAITYFAGLNVANANLGRFSKNLGQSAHEVNAWDSAVELAGGSAQDAQADLMALSGSLTALKATGDISPMVLLLQRMGVAVYDAQGKTRKLTDIFKDLGDKLRTYNRADAFNLARSAGISESTFNLIRAEADERERILATAEANNTVNEQNVEQAAELQKEWREIGQTIKGVALEILSNITPAIQTLFGWVQRLFTGIKGSGALQGIFLLLSATVKALNEGLAVAWDYISKIFNALSNTKAGKWLTDSLKKLQEKAGILGADFIEHELGFPTAKPAAPPVTRGDTRAIGLRNNNPGNVRFAGQAGATLGEGGFAKWPTLAEGIQGANHQLDLYAKRGINTIGAIVSKWAPKSENDTEAYIGRLEKQLGINRNTQLTPADRQRLLGAIFNQGEGNKVTANQISAAFGGNPAALQAAQFADNATANGGLTAQNRTGGTTTVQIDQVNVHTQAKDANGIAAELPDALKRKGVVAQADSGQS